MMVEALNNKGYNGFAISLPSPDELLEIFMLAAPVFLTMMSKVIHAFLDSTHGITYYPAIFLTCFSLGDVLLSTRVLCDINGYPNSCCSSGLVICVNNLLSINNSYWPHPSVPY